MFFHLCQHTRNTARVASATVPSLIKSTLLQSMCAKMSRIWYTFLSKRSLRFIALIPVHHTWCNSSVHMTIHIIYTYTHTRTHHLYIILCVYGKKRRRRIEREIKSENREKNYGHWYALNGNAQITVFILYIKNAYGRV